MPWIGRLFEERYTAFRLAVVALGGVGYLVLAPGGHSLSTVDKVLGLVVIALSFVGVWSPFASVVIISAAMVAGYPLGAGNDMVPAVGLSWAVFELGARRFGWPVWCGLIIALAGSLLNDYDDLISAPLSVVYGTAAWVIAPLLFGLYMRTLRLLNRQAVEQAHLEVVRVRAEERTTIARELHDLVAHHVASIVLRVAVARDVLPVEDPQVRKVLDDVHATGSSALADLRRLVAVLRDPGSVPAMSFVDPDGLPVALRTAIERSHQIGLDVRADLDPEVIRLDARTALALLRLTQEGLANVAKHAGTSARARLSIRLTGDRVEFDLTDSGGSAAPIQGGGHGLVGLRERMEVLGGVLHAGPADGGWRLTATIPIAPSALAAPAPAPAAPDPAAPDQAAPDQAAPDQAAPAPAAPAPAAPAPAAPSAAAGASPAAPSQPVRKAAGAAEAAEAAEAGEAEAGETGPKGETAEAPA